MAKPLIYDEATHCALAIEMLAKGHSLGALAGEIGVTRDCVQKWKHNYPAFAEACEIGAAKSQLWWESTMMNAEKAKNFAPATLIFGLKNRGRDDWRDIQGRELSGPDGQPLPTGIAVTFVRPDEG